MVNFIGSYSKGTFDFEKNFKFKIRDAINNSKKFETSIEKLKDSLGTNLGILLENMLEK